MAGLPPFISFSTSYTELNSAVLRQTDNERFVGYTEVSQLLSQRRQVPLAMVDAITSRLSVGHLGLRSNDLDFDGMYLTVNLGRTKCCVSGNRPPDQIK